MLEPNGSCFFCEDECHSRNENTEPLKTCEFCNQISMCNRAYELGCMTVHRPQGLDRCLPYRISQKSEVGRILVAVKDIKPGELVILDRAAAILPDNDPVCLGCLVQLKPENLTEARCEHCQLPFCKLACAKSDAHKEECKYLSQSKIALLIDDVTKPSFVYQCIAILRLILAQNKSQFLKKQIGKLMTHNDIRKEKPNIGDALKKICHFFNSTCGMDSSLINEESVWTAYGMIETNSLGFGNLKARGIYPMVSCMSHECAPNLFPVSNPGEAVAFRSKRLIRKDEELTIRYTNFVECRLCLRQELKKSWFFDCTCPRCFDGTDFGTFTSSPKCSECQEGFLTPIQPLNHVTDWLCNKCSHVSSRSEIVQMETDGKEVVAGIEDNSSIVEAVEKLEKHFSPSYHLILVLKLKFISTPFTDRRLNEIKIEYCTSVLPVLKKLEGGHSPVIGQVAKELAKTQILNFSDDFKTNKITNGEYLKKIKPYILLQMEAKKWSP